MTLKARLDRLEGQLRAGPCECLRWSPPIVEVGPGEEPPEGVGLPDRCPQCGRRPPVTMVVVHMPAEVEDGAA